MSANVETMFSVRETPWHGLGRIVMDAPASREALELAGLDWQVESRNIYSGTGAMIPGYRANVRSTDEAVLGVVSDRYRIVQNEEAFQFTDDLLGEGVTYETAGSLQGGKKVWMLAKLPEKYIIAGDEVTPYASLILGILIWITFMMGAAGLIVTLLMMVLGMVFGVQALKSTKKKIAIAGLVLNGLMVALIVVFMIS